MSDEARIDRRILRGCLVGGLVGVLLFFGGLAIMGFIPPPSPNASLSEITELWLSHSVNMRIGAVVVMVGGVLSTGFPALFSTLVRRCEGRDTPLAYFQVQLGAINYTFASVFIAIFAVVAFREQDPATYRFWTDVLWLILIGVPFMGDGQMVIIAIATFRDRTQRVFPRWYAWYSLWQAFITAPAAVVFFMPQGGMFGYNGGMSFYFIVGIFGIWVGVTTCVLWHAIDRISDTAEDTSIGHEVIGLAPALQTSSD